MGGPEMAPHTPQRSGRPGEAGVPLDLPHAFLGGPEMAVALLELTPRS